MKKMKKFNEFINNDIFINIDTDVKKLMDEVEDDCGNMSDRNEITKHKSYKKIIENGENSIPFIIEKINNNNCHMIWFKALGEITGNDPQICKYDNVNNYWKMWAINNGY
jgi:hypothetical protein